jgi:hypothetical protein
MINTEFNNAVIRLLTKIEMAAGLNEPLQFLRRNLNGHFDPIRADLVHVYPDKMGFGESHPFYIRTSGGIFVSSWKLVELPGCCGVCVSTEVWIAPNYRGKGINHLCLQLRELIAVYSGYTVLLCTDMITNTAERKTLERAKFKDIYEFTNKRTNNRVAISIKNL